MTTREAQALSASLKQFEGACCAATQRVLQPFNASSAVCYRLYAKSQYVSFAIGICLLIVPTFENVRSSQHGLMMRLEHFTCPEQTRDAITVASIIAYALFMCMCLFWSLLGKVNGHYGQGVLMILYTVVQLLLLILPIVLLYNTPTAPLPSAIALMVVLVCMLKLHSYLATNFAMEAEHAVATSESDSAFVRKAPRVGRDHDTNTDHRSASGVAAGSQGGPEQADSNSSLLRAAPPASPEPTGNSRSARARRRRRKAALAGAAQGTGAPNQAAAAASAAAAAAREVMTVTDSATGQTQEIALSDAEDDAAVPADVPVDAPDHLLPYSSASVDGSEITPHPRQESRQRRLKEARRWPANVTVGKSAYFLAAPTLVYEPSYPRTRRIRRRYITARLLEMIACSECAPIASRTCPVEPTFSIRSRRSVLPHGAVHAACVCWPRVQGLMA